MNLNEIVDKYRDDIVRSTQEVVAIPSVESGPQPGKPFGEGIHRALEYCLGLGKQLGFEVKNVDGYAGYAQFGQGDETMGILVHLDVVPAGDGWTYPPFGGEIHDGKIYGRGSIDDKGPAIAALYAMKAVMESGLPVNKKVRLIFGTDEESGWKDMEYFFSKEPMPDFGITPDANYPVIHAEKGVMDVMLEKGFSSSDYISLPIERLKGGSRPNMVPDQCTCTFAPREESDKLLAHLKSFEEYSPYDMEGDFNQSGGVVVRSTGVSAHGSTPEKGKNAIGQMLAFLATLGLGDSQMEQFILLLNNKIGMDTTGKELGIAFEDEVSGKLTVNLGTIDVDKSSGKAVLNFRYPVKYTQEQVLKGIRDALAGTGVEVKVLHHLGALYVPKDHFLVKTLMDVYTEHTGQSLEPLAIGGGTYARAINTAVAFGAVFPGKPEMAHQKDEYIEINDLILNTKIYAHAIAQLVK